MPMLCLFAQALPHSLASCHAQHTSPTLTRLHSPEQRRTKGWNGEGFSFSKAGAGRVTRVLCIKLRCIWPCMLICYLAALSASALYSLGVLGVVCRKLWILPPWGAWSTILGAGGKNGGGFPGGYISPPRFLFTYPGIMRTRVATRESLVCLSLNGWFIAKAETIRSLLLLRHFHSNPTRQIPQNCAFATGWYIDIVENGDEMGSIPWDVAGPWVVSGRDCGASWVEPEHGFAVEGGGRGS